MERDYETLEPSFPYECGVKVITTLPNGDKIPSQIWGLTMSEAEQIAEQLNGDAIPGNPRKAYVLYSY